MSETEEDSTAHSFVSETMEDSVTAGTTTSSLTTWDSCIIHDHVCDVMHGDTIEGMDV